MARRKFWVSKEDNLKFYDFMHDVMFFARKKDFFK